MACVDRCVVKFMQAQSEVGKIIVKNNEKMQAQMQAQQ